MTEQEKEEYIAQHIDAEPPLLHDLYRETHLRLLYPRMVSGHLQGRLLKMLTHMIRPRLAVEIGTYTGYSALCMAEALEGDAELHTIEINDEQETFIRRWLSRSPYAARITLHMGDALTVIPQLCPERPIDMVYIDGDKRQYLAYYDLLMTRLRPGGYMLVDNTLWDGHVVETTSRNRKTTGIQAFNERVARDPRVERVILPLRDGLTVVRVKSEK